MVAMRVLEARVERRVSSSLTIRTKHALRVRVSPWAPNMEDWQRWIIAPVLKTDVRKSGP